MTLKLKVGADPEIFCYSNKLKHVISAHTFMKGTKNEPYKVKKGAVQLDGTAMEFNIDPAETADEFADNIEIVLKQLREFLPEDCEFRFTPSVVYPKEYFDSLPQDVKELGCNPTYNIYEGKFNPAPVRPIASLCTGSGHIHVGWTEGKNENDQSHMFDCKVVTEAVELIFRQNEPRWCSDWQRRSLYGKRGEVRIKSYGVEVRYPGNSWLKLSKLRHKWLFNSIKEAIDYRIRGSHYDNSYYTYR